MSGLDILRNKLAELGLNKSQIESKSVEMTLSVIANNDIDASLAFQELLNEYSQMRNALNRRIKECDEKERRLLAQDDRNSINLHQIAISLNELSQKIREFKNCLSECETAEGRDAARKVAFFMANTKINNSYDNTAYIKGLANLLIGVSADMPNGIKETIEQAEETIKQQEKSHTRI